MIISASRRTDIPTYYSEWFFNRIREGFVCVRNPMNIHQISKISLSPDVVDGIVFWTKNPIPMLERLDELKDYMYYYQFTLNAYSTDVETNIPSKNDVIIPAFQTLSRKIGANRVIWRYDPILLNEKYSIEYHTQYFQEIAKRLSGYTNKCIISFVDLYRNTLNNTKCLNLLPLGNPEMFELAQRLVEIANKYHLKVESCSEKIDLEQFGIAHGHCVDCDLFEQILGQKLDLSKDKNQREECGCVASIDIGMYNTCKNGCKYCYANYSQKTVEKNNMAHDPTSPLISGIILPEDEVKTREVKSCKRCQFSIFDD
jgi:hypothetical protein